MDKLDHLRLLNRIFLADRPEIAENNSEVGRVLLLLLNEVNEALEAVDDEVLLARELADIGFFLLTACDVIQADIFEEMREKASFNALRYEYVLFDGSMPYGEARVLVKQRERTVYEEFYGPTNSKEEQPSSSLGFSTNGHQEPR